MLTLLRENKGVLKKIAFFLTVQIFLFGSLQNISAPVGLIEKLRPLYYVHRPIPLLMSQVFRYLGETFVK